MNYSDKDKIEKLNESTEWLKVEGSG